MKGQESWFNTTLQNDIWTRKYCYENESLDGFFQRISGGNEAAMQLMKEKKFLPGGRILASRGLAKDGKKITYSNCYVITPPDDHIESIFECATKLARTIPMAAAAVLIFPVWRRPARALTMRQRKPRAAFPSWNFTLL